MYCVGDEGETNQAWSELSPFCTSKWLSQSLCLMERKPAYTNQEILCQKSYIKMLFQLPSLPRPAVPLLVASAGVQVPLESLKVAISPSPQRAEALLALCDLCTRELIEWVLRG